MQDKGGISSSWILLDSQSTVDVFSNPKLLSNICDAKRSLTLYCNAGKAIITKKGDLEGYGTVWYHPDGIANILSLHNVQKKYKVMYYSDKGNGFVVHKADGNNGVFMPSNKGLFYSDVKNDVAHLLINTVDKNKNKYTVKQYSNAYKARSIQDIIGHPSMVDYIKVNILSLHNLQKKYKVTYDSDKGNGFVVHKADSNNRVFMPSNKGLFYSDVKKDVAHLLINTVDKNKNKYTVKQYSNAYKARSIQDIIGCPSTVDYIKYVEQGLIPNCPITKEYIIHAKDILGPNLGSLKGKNTRKRPERATIYSLDNLPNELLAEHRNVTLLIDIMYINEIPFMMTTSWAIHFGTAEMIENETKATIIISLQQIIDTYHGSGFKIKHILGDRQFECIRSHMERQGIDLNITGRDEHVPEIERLICTVKEGARAIVNTLPFEILPHRLIVKILYNVMFWLN